jgi:hypothetical protein
LKRFTLPFICTMCLGLAGCRVILFAPAEIAQSPFTMDAHVYIKRAKIIIRTETSLPPETPLSLSIQPYSDHHPLGKIQSYMVDPQTENVFEKNVTVDEEGKIEPVVIDRPDPSKRYRIKLVAGKMVKYINLMKIEDPDGIGANLTFLSMEEIKERYQTSVRIKK